LCQKLRKFEGNFGQLELLNLKNLPSLWELRSKSRWEDDVRNDLKKMKLMKWAEKVQDRLKWKDIVEKAKTVSDL